MIACYCRAFSGHQTTDIQRAEILLRLTAKEVNPTEVGWFEDHECRPSQQRTAFDALQRSIVDGRTITIVVWKLDHLSQDVKGIIHLLAEWCDLGIRVISVSRRIDLSSPLNRLGADEFVGLSDIEWARRLMRQRITNALGVSERTFCHLNCTK